MLEASSPEVLCHFQVNGFCDFCGSLAQNITKCHWSVSTNRKVCTSSRALCTEERLSVEVRSTPLRDTGMDDGGESDPEGWTQLVQI